MTEVDRLSRRAGRERIGSERSWVGMLFVGFLRKPCVYAKPKPNKLPSCFGPLRGSSHHDLAGSTGRSRPFDDHDAGHAQYRIRVPGQPLTLEPSGGR